MLTPTMRCAAMERTLHIVFRMFPYVCDCAIRLSLRQHGRPTGRIRRMRTAVLACLASIFLAKTGSAQEPEFTHNSCRADDPGPCIIGVPVGLVEDCSGARDAERWPFLLVETEIGSHVNDYRFADSVFWWVNSGIRRTLQRNGRPELEGLVSLSDSGRMDAWSPEGLASRGWRTGDPVSFLVKLADRDIRVPEFLDTVWLPVFCMAWAERIGIPPDADHELAGAWLSIGPFEQDGSGLIGTLPHCPVTALAPHRSNQPDTLSEETLSGAIIFDGDGNWLASWPGLRFRPGSAGMSLPPDADANNTASPPVRHVTHGTYEWTPPVLRKFSTDDRVQRLIVTELTSVKLAMREILNADFLYTTSQYRRCDPGMQAGALIELLVQ